MNEITDGESIVNAIHDEKSMIILIEEEDEETMDIIIKNADSGTVVSMLLTLLAKELEDYPITMKNEVLIDITDALIK